MKISIKQARVGVGLTQEDMARRLGISTPTYGAWENDPNRVAYGNLQRIARITGVEISDLNIPNLEVSQ